MTTSENAAFLAAEALRRVALWRTELELAQDAWERAIVDARARGIAVRTIAESAGVSPQTVLNVCARFNVTGG